MSFSLSRLRNLLRRSHLEREMNKELCFHVEEQTQRNLAAGMEPDEAARAARRQFGWTDRIREEARDARGWTWLHDLVRDLRHAARSLRKSPGFTAVAVLSLALGIGANTAIFTVLKAVLLRSMPVPNPHELRVLGWSGTNPSVRHFTGSIDTLDNGRQISGTFQYPAFRDFQEHADGLAEVFAFFPLHNLSLQTRGQIGTSHGMLVSGNYFSAFGAHAPLGRVLAPDDDRTDAPPTAVITDRFWQHRFARDPAVLGETLTINRHSFTIVGVLSRDYTCPLLGDPADVYVTMAAQPMLEPDRSLTSYDNWWVLVMARMSAGASDAQFSSVLTTVFAQAFEKSRSRMDAPLVTVSDGRRGVAFDPFVVTPTLWSLQAIAAVVLLIACANLAGLLLARLATRRREFAVCAAIGASRGRLLRRSLVESLLLAAGGTVAGLLCATWIRAGLVQFVSDFGFSMNLDTRCDERVLAFAVALALSTAALCGLLPAWRASRVDPSVDLQGGRTGSLNRHRLGRILVAAQVGLSLLLVAAAGLFVRSIANLRAIEPGFDPRNVLIFQLHADQEGYDKQQRIAYFDAVRASLAEIPGVTHVALCDGRLVGGSTDRSGFSIPGRERRSGERWNAHQLEVSDGFFAAMSIPLLAGRDFASTDLPQSQPVMIVNERFAREHFPDEDPIDRMVQVGGTDYRIIGVCGTTLYVDVKDEKPTTMYYAQRQRAAATMNCLVRTALPPMSVLPAARRAVASIDPTIPMAEISTQKALFDRSLVRERMFAVLCGALAGLALLLCCIGLYGLLAYTVTQRAAEIGLRMALGARSTDVARSVIRDALTMTVCGLGTAAPVAIALGFAARKAFFGVPPYDLLTFAGASALLLAVTVFAAWLPARRAAKVDPMTALRAE